MTQEKEPVGTHKGSLAGLVGAAREEAFRRAASASLEEVQYALDDYWIADLNEHATEGPVCRTLAEHLEGFTRDELVELAKGYELRGYSKLKKADLAAAVVQAAADDEEAFAIATQVPRAEYETLCKVLAQPDCTLELTADDAHTRPTCAPLEPWVYLYATDEDAWTLLIPQELQEPLKRLDMQAVEAERALVAGARHVAEVLCDMCGIVRVEDAQEQFTAWYGQAWPAGKFENLMMHDILSGMAQIGAWLDGDDLYLVNYELDERQVSPDDEQGARDVEEFKKYLVGKHKDQPQPKLDEDLRTRDFLDWAASQPSAVALEEFFDNHIPDDEPNDLLYADGMVEDIATLNGSIVDFDQTVADLDERDLCLTAQERAEMLPLVRAMLEDLPYWENNGWSNNQRRAALGQAPAFFDAKGAALKVGRNDPCPCGSGKKFKKCCGK